MGELEGQAIGTCELLISLAWWVEGGFDDSLALPCPEAEDAVSGDEARFDVGGGLNFETLTQNPSSRSLAQVSRKVAMLGVIEALNLFDPLSPQDSARNKSDAAIFGSITFERESGTSSMRFTMASRRAASLGKGVDVALVGSSRMGVNRDALEGGWTGGGVGEEARTAIGGRLAF